MAAHYVAAMRKVQPQGPYYLGGYSFGGRIAVYMANMLKAAGEEVALLALLDPSSHVGRAYVTLAQWLERNEAVNFPRTVYQTARFLWFRLRKAFDYLYARLLRAVMFPIWDHYRKNPRELPKSFRRPDRANRLVHLEHDLMPNYHGDAVHFRAQFSARSETHMDTRDGWNQIIKGKLTVIEIQGLHHEIIQEPEVGRLAVELAKALEKARAVAEAGTESAKNESAKNAAQ